MTEAPSLRKLQQSFLRDCHQAPEQDDNAPSLSSHINTSHISANGLMGIYHHSTVGNIEFALALSYPVVKSLVGERFFHFMIQQFVTQHMPPTPDIELYGGELGDFLENFDPAASLPYLPDVARLEWHYQMSALAPRSQVIDSDALAAIPQDQYFNLYLHLPPSTRFFDSPHPVDKIWEWNQEDEDNTEKMPLNLAEEEGCHLLLSRPFYQVNIVRILPEEQVFLQALQQGGNLFTAYEEATTINEEFDLGHYLQRHITLATFSGFTVTT